MSGMSSTLRRRPGAVALAASVTLLATLGVAAAQRASTQAQPPASAQAPPKSGQAQAAVPPGPVGLWIDHTGRGAVEISQCGTDLCGRIVWLKDPHDKQGRPLVDALNEDKRMRDRPICGLQIIGGLKLQRDGSWDNGWIYDPEQGESFDVEVRMRGTDGLQVKGYKGLKFLSETFQWKRAANDPQFQRCSV